MGIEPTTPALRKRCTTAVLPWLAVVSDGLKISFFHLKNKHLGNFSNCLESLGKCSSSSVVRGSCEAPMVHSRTEQSKILKHRLLRRL